jgi:hypothetical protein
MQTNVSTTAATCFFSFLKSSTCASRLGMARESQSTLMQNAAGIFEVMEIIGKRDSKTVLDWMLHLANSCLVHVHDDLLAFAMTALALVEAVGHLLHVKRIRGVEVIIGEVLVRSSSWNEIGQRKLNGQIVTRTVSLEGKTSS